MSVISIRIDTEGNCSVSLRAVVVPGRGKKSTVIVNCRCPSFLGLDIFQRRAIYREILAGIDVELSVCFLLLQHLWLLIWRLFRGCDAKLKLPYCHSYAKETAEHAFCHRRAVRLCWNSVCELTPRVTFHQFLQLDVAYVCDNVSPRVDRGETNSVSHAASCEQNCDMDRGFQGNHETESFFPVTFWFLTLSSRLKWRCNRRKLSPVDFSESTKSSEKGRKEVEFLSESI